ncbi:MAG: CocE/NonD family hydrolase [Hyphomicrobiaceae bacterium]|nr:CocE/NonD family hydrolase [Hyphomicrobiaceae bacterium]
MPVRVIEHLWIPMADGTRLGARLWLPADADAVPVPAVLEYIPYRKRDGTRGRDEPMHGYFAEHGYAAVRVDMRGTGESDGHMADEYLLQEQDDGLEVIAWIAAQPWCSGAVGMMGKSWGGFNALQVAARRPPALKAIITCNSTDNRYTDDIHYMGGCLLNDNLWWGAIMLAYQARPLDPDIVGEGWRAAWVERLRRMPLFPALWLEHQRYDDYWRHGSVCEDFAAIECPVMAVGGWADSYTNTVPRLLEGLGVPRQGIIGPWAHIYPQDGTPGPAIGFLQQATRWWDRWLKGEANGIEAEPMLRAYIEDAVAPDGTRTEAPGRWVGEPVWPSPTITARVLHLHGAGLGSGRLDGEPGPAARLTIASPQSHGKAAGEWMGTGCAGENPTDQRLDDGGSLNFETAPLDAAVDILGAPVLRLVVSSDAAIAQIAVRLCDVHPDGRSTRVSYQVLNLTHRDSHAEPAPLEPGREYAVTVKLCDCGHRFPTGHRIRVSIGTAYWPLVWPAPGRASVTISTGDSRLELPVRAALPGDGAVAFPPPAHGPQARKTCIDRGSISRYSLQDHVNGITTYVTEGIGGLFGEGINRLDNIGTELAHSLKRELSIRDDDPLSARYVLTETYAMGRDGWRTESRTRVEMTCDASHFHLKARLTAFEDGREVLTRDWDEKIARDLI